MSDSTLARPGMSVRDTALWVGAAALLAVLVVALGPAKGVALLGVVVVVAAAAWALRYPELLLGGLMAAAALDNIGKLASVGSATITVYQGVLVGVVLLFGYLVIEGRERIQRTPADAWFLLAAAAAAVAVPRAADPKAALVALLSFYSSLAVVYLVTSIAVTPTRLRRALIWMLAIGAVLGMLALVERAGIFSFQAALRTYADGLRPRVSFKDPNILGGVLAGAAALGIPLAVCERKLWRSLALWALVGASALGMLVTLSRGAWLGFVVGAVFAILFSPMRKRTKIVLMSLGAAAVVLLFAVVLPPEWVAKKITGIMTENSALNRIYLAESAWRMWLDYPFGVGPGMWSENVIAYRTYETAAGLLESHTTYLTLLVEIGILGVIGILGALVVAGYRTIKTALSSQSREIKVLASSALAGAAVLIMQSLTYSMETSKFLWFMVGAGLAAAALRPDETEEQ